MKIVRRKRELILEGLGLGNVMHEGLGLEKGLGLGLGIKIMRRMHELILEGLGLEM